MLPLARPRARQTEARCLAVALLPQPAAMEERTTEDIDGLAEFITVRQRQQPAGAAAVREPEPEPERAPEPAAAPAPAPAPAPPKIDPEVAVAAAAGQLRRVVLEDGAIVPESDDSSELEAALRQLSSATRSAAGRQAAVRAGVADRCISLLLALAQRVVAAPAVADQAAPVAASLPLVLRSLRNLCAGSRATQEQLWERGAPATALALARRLIEPLDSGVPAWLIGSSAEAVECACLAVQLIGNSAAGHERTSTAAWKLLFPEGFAALLRPPLKAGLRKAPLPSLVSCVAMVMQTCLAKSMEQAAHRQELGEASGLVVRLMEHLVAANADGMLAESEEEVAAGQPQQPTTKEKSSGGAIEGAGAEAEEQVDPQACQWLGLVIAGQCAGGHAETTFDSLAAVMTTAPAAADGAAAPAVAEPAPAVVSAGGTQSVVSWSSLANPAQLRWVEVVSAALATAAATQALDPATKRAASSVAEFFVRRLLPAALLEEPAGAAGVFAPDAPVTALEAVYVAVHTLGLLLAAYSEDEEEQGQEEETAAGDVNEKWRLLSDGRMAELGGRAAVLLGVSGPPPAPPATSTAETERGKVLPRGFKSQLLKLIGNVAFRHKVRGGGKNGTVLSRLFCFVLFCCRLSQCAALIRRPQKKGSFYQDRLGTRIRTIELKEKRGGGVSFRTVHRLRRRRSTVKVGRRCVRPTRWWTSTTLTAGSG